MERSHIINLILPTLQVQVALLNNVNAPPAQMQRVNFPEGLELGKCVDVVAIGAYDPLWRRVCYTNGFWSDGPTMKDSPIGRRVDMPLNTDTTDPWRKGIEWFIQPNTGQSPSGVGYKNSLNVQSNVDPRTGITGWMVVNRCDEAKCDVPSQPGSRRPAGGPQLTKVNDVIANGMPFCDALGNGVQNVKGWKDGRKPSGQARLIAENGDILWGGDANSLPESVQDNTWVCAANVENYGFNREQVDDALARTKAIEYAKKVFAEEVNKMVNGYVPSGKGVRRRLNV